MTADHRSAPSRLRDLATLLLGLMPLAVWLANRSAPLLLALAALALLAASGIEGRLARDFRRLRDLLRTPAGLAALALLAFACVSIGWSHQPLRSLRVLAEALIPLASGLVVGALWPGRAGRWGWSVLGAGLALACMLVMVEIGTGMQMRRLFGLRSQTFIFNPILISFLLLAFPLTGWLLDGRRRTLLRTVTAAVLAGLLVAAILTSDSGAATFGLVVGCVAWGVARILPRFALAALATGFAASLVLAPVMGEVLERVMPAAVHEQLKGSHTRERVDVWLSFGDAVRARPWTGAGFGTSAVYDSHPVAAEVAPARRVMLAIGHPHSLPLQIWAEMGLGGAILAGLCGLAIMAVLAGLPGPARALPVAFAGTVLAIATVGHGAWQAWWIAAIAAATGWFLLAQQDNTGDGR